MDSCWMETLDWEAGQGEVQVHRMAMLDEDIGWRDVLVSWTVTLDGKVLEMLDRDTGDIGWGDDGW